ncbi:MAG: 50S ribosomal protein L17 [Bacteroidetes bacterium]|nr:50S ribosomal protein L17 [Bacteroidota bacterium]NBY30182.1 50S ribosomal protein L17 [Sphingobacteriia bacterium]
MRHGNSINHLSRTYGHRKAMLRNMAVSLILNKRINTTLAKAKELRKFVEPVLTRSKADTMHNRRMVFADLQDKEAVKELFGQVAEKIATRPGGYTRIIKTGFRLGDAAEMCMMELVDFNELLLADSASRKAKTTRRSRSSSKKAVSSVAPAAPLMGQANVEEETAAVLVSEASVEEAPVDAAPMDESPIEASVAAEESSLEVNTDDAVAESTSSEISESEEGKAADEESKEA